MKIVATVTIPHAIELDEQQAKHVTKAYLESVKEGQWTDQGYLWEEHYTSHRFDDRVGDDSHPRYKLVKAVEDLEEILKRAGKL